jgi:Protein of unknown function (DUF2510)
VPQAGWYHDPAGDGYRWWDGDAWTTRVVAGEAGVTEAHPPAPVRPRPAMAERAPAPGRPRPARTERTAPPGWVPGAISLLVAVGAVLLVIGSVQPWVHATAPGVAPVTRLGTDARSAWLIILAGVIVALEAGRWLQRYHPSPSGAVVALLAAVGSGAVAVTSFSHLAAGVASLPDATGAATRTVGLGVPLIAAGCVAVFSGAIAAALHRVG